MTDELKLSDETGSPEEVSETPSAPTPKRKRRRRWVKRAAWVAVLFVVLIGLSLTQTGRGQRLVLGQAMEAVRGSLAGELRVDGIRSGTLLTGVTLTGIRLDAEDGHPFMTADSVEISYWPIGFLLGHPSLRSLIVWGLDLELSQYAEDTPLNVQRLLRERPNVSDSAAAVTPVQIGRFGVRGGTVQLLRPWDGTPGLTTVPGPDGERLQRLAFEGVDLDLESVLLMLGSPDVLEARLASLSTDISLAAASAPLEIREAFGDVTFGSAGIRVAEGAFRLPGTLVRGQLAVGPQALDEAWSVAADLEVDEWGRLEDLQWAEPRIPAGSFRGGAQVTTRRGIQLQLEDVDIALEESNLVADGWISFGNTITMRALEVTVSPLAVSRLEPWLETDVPFEGWLSGSATFAGSLENLEADGRLTIVPTGLGADPTTADFNGTVHRGQNPGATNFRVELDPLNYELLQAFAPEVPFVGGGRGTLELDGRAEEIISVVADFTYEADAADTSRVLARGTLERSEGGDWETDLRGDFAPFSLGALSSVLPDLGLTGTLEGLFQVSGGLHDLRFGGELFAEDGQMVVDATVDLADPGSRYLVDLRGERLLLSSLSSRLPVPSTWTGGLMLEGGGITRDSIQGTLSLTAVDSRVGALRVEGLASDLRASDGLLIADTVAATFGGIELAGSGRLGLAQGTAGVAHFGLTAESLVGLRPMLMGDSILVGDDLSPIEAELMRLAGIEPDTLPTQDDVRLEGGVVGSADLSGSVQDFGASITLDIASAQYRRNGVDTAHVVLAAQGLPRLSGRWDVGFDAAGITWEGRTFDEARAEGTMAERRGRGSIEVVRRLAEAYRAEGDFAFDSLGGQVDLRAANVWVDAQAWGLAEPAHITWTNSSVSFERFRVEREGDDPMRLSASGTLATGIDSDFRLDMEGFHLEQIPYFGQLEELAMGGHADVSLTVRGPAEDPVIDGLFQVLEPRYQSTRLSRLSGALQYADRSATVRVEGWDGERQVLTVSGELPIDLGLTSVETRRLDEPMDITVAADSIDAAVALAYFQTLEDVSGTVSGNVRIAGTPVEPAPSGIVTLEDAAWTIQALGVRHERVSGSLDWNADQTVIAELVTSGTGTSRVTGSVTLQPLSDPTLDLSVEFDRFLAMQRRDMEGWISGSFTLTGTYRRPLAEGTLSVDEGILYVEEFARSAGVVDLSDPSLFVRQDLAVDTTIFVAQPLLADIRNPFVENLRVNIDLVVPRNTWLRSGEMNVEMGGELVVVYDRSAGDLVMVGDLQALRGSYGVFNRTFEVDGGTVEFIGRPGVNPALNIQATTRVRRREGEPLEVLATVEGNLVRPLVTLSSPEAGLAQSDLISYLIIGQATSELALVAGTATIVTGALANQVGSALARETSFFDYFSISSVQGDFLGADVGLGGTLAGTQLEAGRYLGEDVFVVVVLRPSTGSDQDESDPFAGVRIEWAVTDDYNVEAFVEERFLRSGAGGLGAVGLNQDKILGMFFFREWGYR